VILEAGDHLRVAELERVRDAQRDGLPDAAVAVADAGNPVPAFGGDEGGAIERLEAAVLAGSAEDCSWGMPGWGGGEMRTARTFFWPGRRAEVTSKLPRRNAPFIVPRSFPLSQIEAA
jgi:hypothetical protein